MPLLFLKRSLCLGTVSGWRVYHNTIDLPNKANRRQVGLWAIFHICYYPALARWAPVPLRRPENVAKIIYPRPTHAL
jgi:hypothetical protein